MKRKRLTYCIGETMKHVAQMKRALRASFSINKYQRLTCLICCANETAYKRSVSVFYTRAQGLVRLFRRFYTTIYSGSSAYCAQ